MIEVADILCSYGNIYLKKFGSNMPSSHKKTISDMVQCRTAKMGGQVYFCDNCNEFHYSFHSCGNRNCNKCQNDMAEKWLQNTSQRLLPVRHFMVTFTLPDSLRKYARKNQRVFYSLLLRISAQALQTLADDSKYVGGKLGILAILHTWTRILSYHPHAHLIVTGGGMFEDENLWLPANSNFLVPVKALSKIFRAKFRDELKKQEPEIFDDIPKDVWQKNWVVHSKKVGKGQTALKYLAQYIFRPAISNSRIVKFANEKVSFKYKPTNQNQWKIMKLSALEFIRRYLQHVLPKRFVKVRYYGLYAVKNKETLKMLKQQLEDEKMNQAKQAPEKSTQNKILTCPHCGKPLRWIKHVAKGEQWNHAPPEKISLPKNSIIFTNEFNLQLSKNMFFR